MFGLPQLELPFFWNSPATPNTKPKSGSRSRSQPVPPEEPRTVSLGGQVSGTWCAAPPNAAPSR